MPPDCPPESYIWFLRVGGGREPSSLDADAMCLLWACWEMLNREEGTAAVVSLCVPGSLSKPLAVAPSANQGDDAPEWDVAPHS